MKPHKIKDATLSDGEFASLLRDKTFVDYLNVFLSLPIFSQRILYKFSENDFEFDPPLRRTGTLRLDRRRLIQWLLTERIPLFLKTDLYLEYTLCHELLQTELKIRPSSHNANYDEDRIKRDSTFLRQMIGHVSGMRRFRMFLDGSAGQKVLQFWLDAEHFWKIPARSEDRRRTLFRDIQAKYFRNGGVLELPDNEKWRTFTEGITFEEIASSGSSHDLLGNHEVHRSRSGASIYGSKELSARSVFHRMQNLMLDMIKSYWLPKYIIHCRREARNGELDLSKYPDVDKLDLLKIEDPDVREILESLEKKHEKTVNIITQEDLSREKSKMVKMKAMFPHFRDNRLSKCDIFQTDVVEETNSEQTFAFSCNSSESESESTSGESESEAIDSLDSWLYKSQKSTPVGSTAGRFVKGQRAKGGGVENQRLTDVRRQSSSGQAATAPTRTGLKKQPASSPVQSAGSISPVGGKSSPTSLKMESKAKTATLTKVNLNMHTLHGHRPHSPELRQRRELEIEAKMSKQKVSNWLKKSSDQSLRSAKTKRSSPLTPVLLNSGTSVHAKTTAKSQHRHLASFPKHEPHKTAIRGMLQSKLATCQNRHHADSDGPINLDTYYLGVVCFRRNNNISVAAIAADRLAGHPFERFLRTRQQVALLNYLHFWQDAQMFLTTRATDLDNLGEFLKLRRAKTLLLKYLHPCGENRIDIGTTLTSRLTQLLPVDEGDDILRHAQDVACQLLRNQWRTFVIADRESFLEAQTLKRDKKSATPATPRTSAEDDTSALDIDKALRNTVKQSHQIERPRSRMQEDHAGLYEERMFWALQLAQHVSHLHEHELSLGGMMEAFSEDDDYGSLKVAKQEIVRNKTLRDYIFPPKIDIEKIKVSRREIKTPEKLVKKRPSEFASNDPLYARYPFLKPIKRNGVVIERPPEKPGTFLELLREPAHVEFFKRFLQREGNDVPVTFWMAVDSMRKSSGKDRQMKVQEILKHFFSKTAGFGAALCCDAEIIQEIPKMNKVNPSMLISAQVCVSKSLETRWGPLYAETFPTEQPVKEVLDPTVEHTADGRRKWTKENTKNLWINFVKAVSSFRRGFLHPTTANLFRAFLKNEATRDLEKKTGSNNLQTHTGPQASVTLRRVIKHRIIAVEKLVADMNFLIEVDRYRIFADTVMTQAEDGVYNHAAEALVGQKAKAIINCYIESDIPPKLQVNISPDVAETIVGNYNDQIIERGLFHEATISIFPTLAHLWKKFNAQRIFDSMPPRPLVKHRITPHGSTKIPNYVTMDKVKTKRIISHSDDDCMRILFSLAHGIRHITPHFTHDHELLPKGFSGSQLDLIQYARGLALHHGDSESFISRLTNLVARRNDAAGELSPEYESHAHGRRRKSSMSQLSSRKLIRPPVEHIAVVSRSDLRSEKSATPAGVEMSHLLKLMNPKAYEMT